MRTWQCKLCENEVRCLLTVYSPAGRLADQVSGVYGRLLQFTTRCKVALWPPTWSLAFLRLDHLCPRALHISSRPNSLCSWSILALSARASFDYSSQAPEPLIARPLHLISHISFSRYSSPLAFMKELQYSPRSGLDVHLPEGVPQSSQLDIPLPALIYCHGGGLIAGDRKSPKGVYDCLTCEHARRRMSHGPLSDQDSFGTFSFSRGFSSPMRLHQHFVPITCGQGPKTPLHSQRDGGRRAPFGPILGV